MYKIIDEKNIKRLSDGAVIPTDTANADYQAFIDWLGGGNVPDHADQSLSPVYRCDPWQIRKALNNLNLRQQVEDAVAASNNIQLKDGWAHATVFSSADQFVLEMGAAVGKTAEETAQVIQYASTL